MRTARRLRTPAARLTALTVSVAAAALVGLSSSAATAAPTTAAPTTAAPTTAAPTTAASTTAATTSAGATATTASPTTVPAPTTSTAPTSTTSTSAAPTSTATTPAPTADSTSSGPTPVAPGPQCARSPGVQTPVLCLPKDFDEDQPAQASAGDDVFFEGQVIDNGAAVSGATVTITLPPQLRLAPEVGDTVTRIEEWWLDDDEDATVEGLNCTTSAGGSTVSCPTGSIAAGDNFLIEIALVATSKAKPGTSASFSMSLASTTAGPEFPSTHITGVVDFLGQAHLVVTLAPNTDTITVGTSHTLIGTVHNNGPNAAPNAVSVGIVAAGSLDGSGFPKPSNHFIITNSGPLPDPDGKAGALVVHPSGSSEPVLAFWPVGTLAPGQTASVKVTVKALSVGRATLGFAAFSDADDPPCDSDDDSACREEDETALVAVAAPATSTAAAPIASATTAPATTTSAATAATAVPASPAALPNTGFRPAPWLGSAVAAILLGAALIVLGAPPRRSYGGQHR
jgi:hypothetical protein